MHDSSVPAIEAMMGQPPGKIIAVHLNYPSRAAQRGRTPVQPGYFLKPTTSLSASGTPIERPAGCELLAFEGEIALIIGKDARRVTPEEGWSHVSGVTAANDFGVYDLKYADKGSNLRSKGGDGFTPLGPAVLAANLIDPNALLIRTWVNGQQVQEDTTETLLFPFGRLIADLSQLITLEAGDIILTGTPAGSTVIEPGDVVEVAVEDADGRTTGRLTTPVVEGTTPFGDFGAEPKTTDDLRAEAEGTSGPAPLADELIAKINSVGTATLSSQLRKRGLNTVSIDGLTPTQPSKRLVGRARTLRFIPGREDLFASHGGGYNAQKRAFDSLNPGDVLVIEARGERRTGTVGDILALRAKVRGAAGIVTDGGVRDLDAVTDLGLPTYHAGAHPAVLGRKHVPWDTDITITCGGTAVQPGDVIVGDADGVLVIPPTLINELVDDAIEQERQEAFIAEQVATGESVDGLYPMNAKWKVRYEAWLSTQR
ncbi:MAG: fumarylacetoacetate hydrolase family protein [Microbacteriaceae bacterium]|nr:fumarylacetoacetate hydrolase family protein [Microbacteriaceae bacterium]